MATNTNIVTLSFLGKGWSFPPTFSKKTLELLMTADEEDINKKPRNIVVHYNRRAFSSTKVWM